MHSSKRDCGYSAGMAFHLRNPEAEQLLRELQALTGETPTDVIRIALAERLEREKTRMASAIAVDPAVAMQEIWARLSLITNRDLRPDNEILGYGPDGLRN